MTTESPQYGSRENLLTFSNLSPNTINMFKILNINIRDILPRIICSSRLTIAEEGCERILSHTQTDVILSKLILSLGVDEAGRGMNSAFAIGRLCDMEVGRCKLLSLHESEKMVKLLNYGVGHTYIHIFDKVGHYWKLELMDCFVFSDFFISEDAML